MPPILIFRPVLAAVLCLTLAAPVAAKPPLREVAQIDDALMMVAIADEIRKTCSDISARMIRALGTVNGLKAQAQALGYTDDEIKDYVRSDAEKKRMRAKATGWLAARGVAASNSAQLCRFGKSEIARDSEIGRLLR
jgi:hypothetical protein